jgi:flagellar assembly factor FliW
MLVKSTRFGEQDVEETKIIRIPVGMPGFVEAKRFVLLTPPKPGPFLWLQSVDNPDLAFVVVDAKECAPEYSFSLTDEEFKSLELDHETSGAIFLLVVTLARNPQDITVNLQGPIVLNPERMVARQIVLDGAKYTTRHHLFAGASK